MSEYLQLGGADAETRWFGVRRHQAILAVVGAGLVGDWMTRTATSLIEFVAGLLLVASVIPTYDQRTVAEWALIILQFALRPRWLNRVGAPDRRRRSGPGSLRVASRLLTLVHRGRLDLTGRDVECADGLARLADAMSAAEHGGHFSIHTSVDVEHATTWLVLPVDATAPEGWVASDEVEWPSGRPEALDPTEVLIRWRYVRGSNGLVRVLRVRDFGTASDGRAVLERIQFAAALVDVVIHVDVVARARGHRVVSRAVHRDGSDDAVTTAAGFRRNARSRQRLLRLHQREELVAGGRSLLRIAVFVVVRAADPDQLRTGVVNVRSVLNDAGLQFEQGLGRQASWFADQSPCGLGR